MTGRAGREALLWCPVDWAEETVDYENLTDLSDYQRTGRRRDRFRYRELRTELLDEIDLREPAMEDDRLPIADRAFWT